MDRNKFLAHLKKRVRHLSGEELNLASMFLYNWTKGPWTPASLSDEQLSVLKKRVKEIEDGEVEPVSMEEVWQKFEEKYGYVREGKESYEAERKRELLNELPDMLDQISTQDLIWFDIFLRSHTKKDNLQPLRPEERASIERGLEDAKAGRLTDAFEFLRADS
jgi:hypothetical protein